MVFGAGDGDAHAPRNPDADQARELAIVWHSRTGAARAMAEAAAAAARGFIPVRLIPAESAQPAQMIDAAAYLFVCPENLGTVSGVMKEFLDRCYYPLLGRIEGRPYATAIAAGSDGEGAQRLLDRVATGWRLRRVADPLIVCTVAQAPMAILAPKTLDRGQLAPCRGLGGALAAGLDLGIF